MTTNLASLNDCLALSFSTMLGSSKTSAASSKLTQCLRRLAAALASSHSNLKGLSAAFLDLFGLGVGGRWLSIAGGSLNRYFREEGEWLFVAEDAADFAVGVHGELA